jgi:mannose-1-phosphate guanylyltransferase
MITPKLSGMLLCAGIGTRLMPLTKEWPKCLMPVNKIPLLDYWLKTYDDLNIKDVLINTHHHSEKIHEFLERPKYYSRVSISHEKILLGTAGTLSKNKNFFKNRMVLVAHADNLCQCNFKSFLNFHLRKRLNGCLITMMTFQTDNPKACGIIKQNKNNIVEEFYEKVETPPGNIANGAVYIMEPEVIDWINNNKDKTDISTEVIPNFLGKIAAWHNNEVHRDIGSPVSLKLAQREAKKTKFEHINDDWQNRFNKNKIHDLINNL